MEDLRRKLEDITAMKEEIEKAHRLLAMGREEERKRLAWEIHDIPLQKSIVILYGLQKCQKMARSSLLKKLKELEGNVLSLSHEFRRICQGLRSPTLDTLGLDSAIRSYTEEFKSKPEGRGLEVKLDLMKDGKRVPEDIAINLFRIYQEALANVAKHAHAKEVEVKFKLSSEEVELSIKDDGRGFVVPRRLHQFVKDRRLGLMGIHERARMVGGKLEVISRPEEGTEIRVRVPLNANLNFPRKLDKLSK